MLGCRLRELLRAMHEELRADARFVGREPTLSSSTEFIDYTRVTYGV